MTTNSNARELIPLVRLYRILGKPELAHLRFSSNLVFTQEIFDIAAELWTILEPSGSAGNIELELDCEPFSITLSDDIKQFKRLLLTSKIEISVTLRRNHKHRFYENEDSLITLCAKENTFEFPKHYYIISCDYCHGIDEIVHRPSSLMTIDSIVEFVRNLKEIANKVDSRGESTIATFYVSDTETKEQINPVDLELTITSDLKTIPLKSFSILDEIVNPKSPDSLRDFEKVTLLKTALCEEVRKAPSNSNKLQFIIEHWQEVEKTYHRNLETFITGLSFSKLRHEVEEKNLQYLDNINSALVDISMKLTALPAAFGLWVFIFRADHSAIKQFGFFFAILIMTAILWFALDGHVAKYKYVRDSVDKQLQLFRDRLLHSPKDQIIVEDINNKISEMETLLKDRTKKIGIWLRFCQILLVVPVLVMGSLLIYVNYCSVG